MHGQMRSKPSNLFYICSGKSHKYTKHSLWFSFFVTLLLSVNERCTQKICTHICVNQKIGTMKRIRSKLNRWYMHRTNTELKLNDEQMNKWTFNKTKWKPNRNEIDNELKMHTFQHRWIKHEQASRNRNQDRDLNTDKTKNARLVDQFVFENGFIASHGTGKNALSDCLDANVLIIHLLSLFE